MLHIYCIIRYQLSLIARKAYIRMNLSCHLYDFFKIPPSKKHYIFSFNDISRDYLKKLVRDKITKMKNGRVDAIMITTNIFSTHKN